MKALGFVNIKIEVYGIAVIVMNKQQKAEGKHICKKIIKLKEIKNTKDKEKNNL